MRQVVRSSGSSGGQASLAGHRPSAQVSRVSHLGDELRNKQKTLGRISNHQAKASVAPPIATAPVDPPTPK